MKKKVYQSFVRGLVTLTLLLPITGHVVFAQNVVSAEERTSPYFQREILNLPGGVSLEKAIINGPPSPPPGITRTTVNLPQPDPEAGVMTLTVPAFSWSFGCSATSAAMIAGYYDRGSYPNIYTGPTNGGVIPLNNSSWPDWIDGSNATRHQCPLSATHQGLDGRTTKGHVDDYWVEYLSADPDPFIGNWTEHSYSECTGDYMKTNQSNYGNADGSTTFYNWTDGSPLYADEMVTGGIADQDGGYGLKLFFESRGYQVSTMYNQYIYGYGTDPTKGFTFAQYKAQIDAGHPVMIHVEGHTMVGVGYDDSGSTVYLHDTWDYSTHTMTWGGSYSGWAHYAVTVLNLAGGGGDGGSSSFSWPMFLPAITGKPKPLPSPQWGVRNWLCCSGSGVTFSVTNSGTTKSSYLATCESEETWQGYVTSTTGKKTFTFTIASSICGDLSGTFSFTLEQGKSYWIVADYDNGVVIRVYEVSNASSVSSGTSALVTTQVAPSETGRLVTEKVFSGLESNSFISGEFQSCLMGN